jgi:hypothetical protein
LPDLSYCAVCRLLQPQTARCLSCAAEPLRGKTAFKLLDDQYDTKNKRIMEVVMLASVGAVAVVMYVPLIAAASAAVAVGAFGYHSYRKIRHGSRAAVALLPAARPPERTGYTPRTGRLVPAGPALRAPMSGQSAIVTRHDVIAGGEVVLSTLGWCDAQLHQDGDMLALRGPLELLRSGPPVAVQPLPQATMLVHVVAVSGAAIVPAFGQNATVEERVLAAGPARVHLDAHHAQTAAIPDAPYRAGSASAMARPGAPILVEPESR